MPTSLLFKSLGSLDEFVTEQFRAFEQKWKIQDQRNKHKVGLALNAVQLLTRPTRGMLVDSILFYLSVVDGFHSYYRIKGTFEYHQRLENYQGVNRSFRAPIFVLGTAFLAKFGLDIVQFAMTGEYSPESEESLQRGIGLWMLASSMYTKATDHPPYWKA